LKLLHDVYHRPLVRWFHFVRYLPSGIAARCASLAAAAQVMHKCCAQKPGFYEVREQAFEQGTPGV
jgi:hypothetical protein